MIHWKSNDKMEIYFVDKSDKGDKRLLKYIDESSYEACLQVSEEPWGEPTPCQGSIAELGKTLWNRVRHKQIGSNGVKSGQILSNLV